MCNLCCRFWFSFFALHCDFFFKINEVESFFIETCFILVNGSKATLLIGGITNPSSRIGKEQKVALKLAIQSFSTNDSVLLLNATDLSSIDTLQGNSIAQDLIGWGANVIITTGTSQQVLVAGTAAIGAKTPIISLIPSSFISGPLSFQISYSEAAFVHCIVDFVKLHNWPKIITIYEDDTLSLVSNTNLLLEEALRANGSKLEYHAVFRPQNSLSDWEKIVEAELYQMMQYESTVYIVLHSSEGLALSLFKKAKELNMTSPNYVWICGNDITDLLNSTLPPEFIANNMQGVVGIKSYINESAEYQEFFSKFQKMFASDYGMNNENIHSPGVYAVRAYDALHAVSLATNESKMRNISLVEALSLVNFEGLSVWYLERNDEESDNDFHDPKKWKHWAASVWLLCNSIFLKIDQGVGSYHAKLVLLLWFLLVQVLLSSFTASLSSILVAEKVSPNIDNLKVGYNSASFVHDYLLSTFNYKPENLVPINRPEDFSTAFENGIINAAYLELPYLRVFLSDHSNYATSGESRTLGGFGFAFHKQSPLRADFSTAILRLQESGKIMKLQSEQFHVSLYSSSNSVKQRKESILGLANFTYLFIFTTGFSTFIALDKCFGCCKKLTSMN
ncbi:hypothetical protein LUZ63_018987 [Rhynchospora breviuscula]|uniref:Ionotropic glutamate receptor C-terminal domain-containing protein n=1 Tax=Rhynchospora breviuscula TaxID=2022672 RepID=A0A9Q0HIE5_9POAL|nr:hypothetical protein LUZ63_018987 [Rhynchospora breviuscula]